MDAVTHCVTSAVTHTTMTTQPLNQEVQTALDRYRNAVTAFESAVGTANRMKADLEKHTKAAQAADAEALAARNEAASLMRDSDASMKQLRDLKGKERAAYTLAEDYRSIIAEVQLALDEATLEARVAHLAESYAYTGLVSQHAEELLRSSSQTLQPFAHAIHILADAYSCQARDPGGAQWEKLGYATAMDAALEEAFSVVRKCVKEYGKTSAHDHVLSNIERPSGRANFPPAYAATVQRVRTELSKRKARLREAAADTLS
ncbi:hypothetical protein [Cupriavidus sp. DL-D2]|uniref:hypothetical protein n=1 Tax=Cupriavidus sp. DL-D2 TaxID=3144974 RepID=UPI003214C650